MTKTQKTTGVFGAVLLVMAIGCVPLSHVITPAEIDSRAVEYTSLAKVADPNEFKGYANLAKAIKLEKAVADAYQVNQFELDKLAAENDLKFSQLKEITIANRKSGLAIEEKVFGEKGILPIGLSLLGAGSLAGVAGLMRKRPGDLTPEEVKQAVSGKDAELTAKEKQIAEIVKGVEDVIQTAKTKPAELEQIKNLLAKRQSSDTRETVAKIKANA